MNQTQIKLLFKTISDEVTNLAKSTTKDYVKQAKKDGMMLVDKTKQNVITWAELVAEGKLSTEDFEWLMFRQKDLVAMTALQQAGLAQIRIEGFKQGVIGIIIDSVFSLVKV